MSERTALILTGEEVLRETGGLLLKGEAGTVFRGISTDSRTICLGNLFVPLVGANFDGHDFLNDVVKAGASGFLVQKGREGQLFRVKNDDLPIILVEDTLWALGNIAHFRRELFSIPVVAVTGSSGKTTTKEMIADILGLNRKVLKSQGNFNNLIGLPQTLLALTIAHDVVVLELGTNKRGEIGRLAEIASPDIGVITSIGPAHLEGFGTIEAVREEKGDLFRMMGNKGIVVVNVDDENVGVLAGRWGGEKITFGFDEGADVRADDITRRGNEGLSFTLKIGELKKDVSLAVVGRHNVRNALAAAAVCWSLGVDLELICRGLESFEPVYGRMVMRRLKNEAFLVDDSYNANPSSMKEALKTLSDMKGKHRGIAVLGDMLELGAHAMELHEEIGRIAADVGLHALILKGAYSRAVAFGAMEKGFQREQILFMEKTEDMVGCLETHLQRWDWVLVKGSRGMKLDEVVTALIRQIGLYDAPFSSEGVIIGD